MKMEKRNLVFDLPVWIGSVVMVFGLLAADAFADGVKGGADDPVWRAECGSCHVAYPPALLPAPAWRAQMATLKAHYGSDATLDPTTAAHVGAFLERNAGRDRGTAAATAEPPRITTTTWFVKEHRKVPAPAWKSAAVKSAANCGACHAGADKGSFDERAVRIPN